EPRVEKPERQDEDEEHEAGDVMERGFHAHRFCSSTLRLISGPRQPPPPTSASTHNSTHASVASFVGRLSWSTRQRAIIGIAFTATPRSRRGSAAPSAAPPSSARRGAPDPSARSTTPDPGSPSASSIL